MSREEYRSIKAIDVEDPQIFQISALAPNPERDREVSSKKRKQLRDEWKRIFPELEDLRIIKVQHQVRQDFFEAICQIPNLNTLILENTRLSEIQAIEQLKNLNTLIFRGTSSIESLKGIEKLIGLKEVELDCFFGIQSIVEFEDLKQIEFLHLYGGIHGQRLNIKSIDPIGNIENLSDLALDIKSNIEIYPLFKLKRLKRVIIPEKYHDIIRNGLQYQIDLK